MPEIQKYKIDVAEDKNEELSPKKFLKLLEQRMKNIRTNGIDKKSHIKNMYGKGGAQIAKKFGEESVELIIASNKIDTTDFLEEAADTYYYFLLLLHDKGLCMEDVLKILKKRKIK